MMVKPSGFVDGLREILDLPPQLVAGTYRALREAKLIDTGPRGVNARSSTCRDAARMLIALMMTDRPTLAATAVQDLGQMVAMSHRDIDDMRRPDDNLFSMESSGLQILQHTFEDGLTEVIRRYGEDQQKPYWRKVSQFLQPWTRIDVYVESASAVISIHGHEYSYNDPIIRTFPRRAPDPEVGLTVEDEMYIEWFARKDRWKKKISTTRQINHELLGPIGSLICDERPEILSVSEGCLAPDRAQIEG